MVNVGVEIQSGRGVAGIVSKANTGHRGRSPRGSHWSCAPLNAALSQRCIRDFLPQQLVRLHLMGARIFETGSARLRAAPLPFGLEPNSRMTLDGPPLRLYTN